MDASRRTFSLDLALGAGALLAQTGTSTAEVAAGSRAARAGDGGFGRDAVALPPGDAVAYHDPRDVGAMPDFRYALDATIPKGTTGGWAKEVSARQFPISSRMSGVHMFLDPGASRELHWHAAAAEWAFVIDGRCQTVVLDPTGASEINNFEPGDLWYFPLGHGHSIQAIGDKPCHFVLSFDNGDTSPEHGTFGITDWIDVTPHDLLALDFGLPAEAFDAFPKGEVYIQAGRILPASEALEAPWPRESTHKFRLLHEPRAVRDFGGGTFRVATTNEWPAAKSIAGGLMTIRPGEMLKMHWHPNANEFNYFLGGTARVALFGSGGRSKVATCTAGDVTYYPQGFGHAIQNVGSTDVEIVQTWDNGRFEEIVIDKWVQSSPAYLLANNFAGVPASTLAAMRKG